MEYSEPFRLKRYRLDPRPGQLERLGRLKRLDRQDRVERHERLEHLGRLELRRISSIQNS